MRGRGRVWAALASAALGCAGSKGDSGAGGGADTAPAPTEGLLALTFAIDSDYAAQLAEIGEAPRGSFYGSFWRGDEVTGAGPVDGAVDLGAIEVSGLDLALDGTASAVLFTSGPLPVGEVVVLGFLDTDANSTAADRGPDAKDPVTLPSDNDFDVLGGETTEARVFFGLLNPI
jgi:hypothetical protein